MAGRVAPYPEITGRGHEPLAEMPEPDAVDQHARRQRILGIGDCLGQLEPAAPFLEWLAILPRQQAKEPPRNRRSRPARIARAGIRGDCKGCGASFMTMARAGAAG